MCKSKSDDMSFRGKPENRAKVKRHVNDKQEDNKKKTRNNDKKTTTEFSKSSMVSQEQPTRRKFC